MATFSDSDPFFRDHTRSPRSMRQANMQRHFSRPFDGYNQAGGRFGDNNPQSSLRYETVRDAFDGPLPAPPVNNPAFPYDIGAAQTWNAGPPQMQNYGNGLNGLQTFGGVRGMKPPPRPRADMPTIFDQPAPANAFFGGENGALSSITPRRDLSGDGDDELIPTAIVIKNIPFAVKKEQLQGIMTDMNLPLPYAFNYHFDNGVFRGLAFANFTSADETAIVIRVLNHFELNGRKLRVEYKKMLPLEQRERIERDKREKRGQLEEQHRPMPPNPLQSQMSFGSLASQIPRNTPSPASQGKPDIDMNDPKNMEFFSKILLFKNNTSQEVLIFPPTLNPTERRIVHGLAHRLGLHHSSRGVGEQRQVHIFRNPPGTSNNSPPNPALADAFQGNDGYRRNLSRAATTDFNEARQYEAPSFNTLRGQQSVGMLQVDTNGFRHDANLRSAKSFHDLRFRGPSPVSAGGFPATASGSRLATLNDTEASNAPTITPTTSHGLSNDESFLINGVNGMNMGAGASHQTSPPRRGRFPFSSWDDTDFSTTAPIGSNRTVSVNADNRSQERMALRQPRGPGGERNAGFRRQNGRGSDELRNASSVIAE